MTAKQIRTSPFHHDPEAVKWAREAKGWSKSALATAADIAPSLLSMIESGDRNATPAVLIRLARALNCPVSVLERKREDVAA